MVDHDRCPICGRALPTGNEAARVRPFCSPRCRMIDLGSWLEGSYRIGSAPNEEEVDAPTTPEEEDKGS